MIKLFWNTQNQIPPKTKSEDDENLINYNWGIYHKNNSDEWIYERSGIKERRVVNHHESDGVGPCDLAIPAVEEAIANAMIKKEDIDFIIFATSTPDYYVPGSSCILQDKMGFDTIGALDIRVQCSGFIYGISIAEQYIKSGKYNNVLFDDFGPFIPNRLLDSPSSKLPCPYFIISIKSFFVSVSDSRRAFIAVSSFCCAFNKSVSNLNLSNCSSISNFAKRKES